MQVQIKDVNVEWIDKGRGKGKYGKAVVNYLYNGENRRQTIVSFSNPEVFKKVQELQGQNVEVEVGKNDGGFSEWRNISAQSAASGPTGTSGSESKGTVNRVSGSTYETKEERAARQTLIIRQSSLSTAKDVLSVGAKTPPDPKAILELAEQFNDWVIDGYDIKTNTLKFDTSGSGFDDMDQDIPF